MSTPFTRAGGAPPPLLYQIMLDHPCIQVYVLGRSFTTTGFIRRRFTTCPTFRQSTFYEYTFLWVLILRVHSTSLLYIAHLNLQLHVWEVRVWTLPFHESTLYSSMLYAVHVLRCPRFPTLLIFHRFCFVHFLFYSSNFHTAYLLHIPSFGHVVHVLRVQAAFIPSMFYKSIFTSLHFAQSTFESPRFTFAPFPTVNVLDMKFTFCNVHVFWDHLYRSMFSAVLVVLIVVFL